ncbi:MAG: mechanosensitive ion channel family protein [Holophagales bacterium]|nr:mechanosensitive ion channel family protein [Holophagales bacterium]
MPLHCREPRPLLSCPAAAWALLAALLLLAPPPSPAQDEPPPSTASATDEGGDGAAAEEAVEVPEALASPQAAMRTFLEAFDTSKVQEGMHPLDQAAMALDLSALDESLRRQAGRDLAVQLKDVLDRTALIDIGSLSDQADAEPWTLQVAAGGGTRDLYVVLAPDSSGRWLFTSQTLGHLPEMLSALRDRQAVEGVTNTGPLTFAQWLRGRLPPSLLGTAFLLESWQWLALLILILLGVLVDRILTYSLQRAIERYLRRRMERTDPDELHTALRPTGLLVASLVWWVGLLSLGLPTHVLVVLAVAVKFVAITSFVWAAYRLVDVGAAIFTARAERTESKFDDLLVPLFRKSGKIFVASIGLVFIADNLDIDITSLVAGLGIGGLALALAAQDVVRNLFGSLTVILDQPFSVGDGVKIGDVEVTVVELGFRSTRIRTFYDSVITLPNANLISASVDNLGVRAYRRWNTHLGLTYETPAENVEAFCEGLRELIRRHPYTRKDSFHVYLNRFGGSSIDVLLYMFFDTPDWATELRERHRLGLDILRLARELEVDFAYPTQTLFLKRPEEAPLLGEAASYGERLDPIQEDARERARRLVEGALGGRKPPPVGQESREP